MNTISPSLSPELSLLVSFYTMICYVVVGGFSAMTLLDTPRLALIAPLTAFAAVFGVSSAIAGGASASILGAALLALFPFVCGTAIAVAMKNGAKRTGAILTGAVVSGFFCAVVIALSEYLMSGSISLSALGETIDATREQTIKLLGEQLAELGSSYPIDLASLDIEGMVNGVFNILPAIAVLIFAVISFFAQLTLLALGKVMNVYHKFEKKDTEFTLSAVTAILFAVSYIGSVLMSESDSAALAVMDNLSLILMPPLALKGLLLILPRKEGNTVRVGCFPLVFLAFLVAFAPSLAVLFLAIWGAYLIIKEAVVSSKNSKK